MKPITIFNKPLSFLILLMFSSLMLFQTGCKKSQENSTTLPTKFTDLKVDPAFQFESFVNLDVTIKVTPKNTQGVSVIRIFQGDPAHGGKAISMGSTDVAGNFVSKVRVPSRLKTVWISNLNWNGLNEFAEVQITGKTLSYNFGQKNTKSSNGTSSNDCNTGTPITVNGEYTIASGQTYVVHQGVNLTNLKLNINSGGTVRICGTANLTQINGVGNLIISPSGYVTIPVANIHCHFENYGTTNCAQAGSSKNFAVESDGAVINWGTLTMSNGLNIKGSFVNNYHLTVVEDAQATSGGRLTNNCQMFVNSTSPEAFKVNGGNASSSAFVQGANAFLKIAGKSTFQGYSTFGLQSLVETGTFSIQGTIYGPGNQGSQIHALGSGNNVTGAALSGYIDIWGTNISPKNGTFGANITWHSPGYTIDAQDCDAPSAPSITSSLSAAGIVGTPITPYTVTATGSAPITFNATNLPAGLSFNPSTNQITGTPTTAQVKNVNLSADNFMGTDNKTLEFSIIVPGNPPVITSATTAKTTIHQPYSYVIEATSQETVTYQATNLPSGLTFNSGTHTISGSPSSAGNFNINLTATNTWGSDHATLNLTVGEPPLITSSLAITGTTGQQLIPYTATASGSGTIDIHAENLPAGLNFDEDFHTINGTPSYPGTVYVGLTAHSEFGTDSKTLAITINEPVQPPRISSDLNVTTIKGQPFSYQITANGTQPYTFNATNLPEGLSFDPEFGVISGIPTVYGAKNITLTASNSAGTDTEILVLNILNNAPVFADADGDGIADELDAYPNDPTRAFNSFYPNEVDYASYAFEDLWPNYGDYDFNDLVVNFNYKIVTNAQNKIVDVITKFKVKAAGASFNNGFGISFDVNPDYVESVTGCIKVGNTINIDPKGFEAGHTNKTVIIAVDAVNTLLGRSVINTIHSGYTVQSELDTIVMHLSTPQASVGNIPFNPFIYIDQDRGKEVHLKDHAPTALANLVYFGTMNDGSNPGIGQYYRSTTGLPWGIEIPVDFEYPLEKADILQTYLHFAAWAQSSGSEYPDWYMNLPGYRNAANIY